MAKVLFSASFGKVVRIGMSGIAGAVRPISANPAITFEQSKSIFTAITIEEQTIPRFTRTLGKAIYIYAVADNMGRMTVSGISFESKCNDRVAGESHGLAHIRRYYHKNKVTARKDPLSLVIGAQDMVVRGYLLGWNGRLINPETRVFEWSLDIATIPEVPKS